MPLLTCPTCGAAFEADSSNSLPFCSARCKQIDLGRWLSEKQTLPYVRPPEDEEEPMQGDQPSD
jgi:endogenous inhibitor of DNA gyrase (YacG/DUF329 family)